jgi:hypothetical protein
MSTTNAEDEAPGENEPACFLLPTSENFKLIYCLVFEIARQNGVIRHELRNFRLTVSCSGSWQVVKNLLRIGTNAESPVKSGVNE